MKKASYEETANLLKNATNFWNKNGFVRMAKACYIDIISPILGDIEVVKYLQKEGVDLKAFDCCAVKIAKQEGYTETVKLLESI